MKTTMMIIAAALSASCLANEFDDVVIKGATDKANPVGYKVGEKVDFALAFNKLSPSMTNGTLALSWVRTGDDGKRVSGKFPLDGKKEFLISTVIEKPGFAYIQAEVVDAKGNLISRDAFADGMPAWEGGAKLIRFLGAAGAEIEKLDQSKPEPADFDAFWARQKRRLADVPMNPVVTKVDSPSDAAYDLFHVKIDCAGPRPCFGWMMIPKNAKQGSLKAELEVHGYGAWNKQGQPGAGSFRSDTIFFAMNAHGCDPAREDSYYDLFRDGVRTPKYDYAFSPYQNEYPEGCYFNGMALRVIRAFDFLKSRPEWNGKDLICQGGSQGGLQTMWAAGLVDGLTEANPNVPWCCDFGGDTKGRMVFDWRIPVTEGILYYDPVNMAKRAKCRVNITRAGLGDHCCYPCTIAVLYNYLPADKRSINWVQGSWHGYVPSQPNQSIELPSGKVVQATVGANVFTGQKLDSAK